MPSRLVFATQNARLINEEGLSYNIVQSEPWPEDDPLVLRHPSFFTDYPVALKRTAPESSGGVVERATRAPGEKRAYHRHSEDGASKRW
jgi:hypothetical protein